jgi:hypothetical protein
MNNTLTNVNTKTEKSSFNVYIDLFNKGELNEILIVPAKKNFSVLFDDFKLATIEKEETNNTWTKVNGTMPKEKLEQIVNMINLKLASY